jgi:integrase
VGFELRRYERLMSAARKSSRWGHRDATMILLSYRHGLRASELCDLQWHQVELTAGRLHVRRAKNGTPSVQPHAGRRIARRDIFGHPYARAREGDQRFFRTRTGSGGRLVVIINS